MCAVCEAAAMLEARCLAHLDDAGFLRVLDDLRSRAVALDMRGVELESSRWVQVTHVLTRDDQHGPDLEGARLTQTTFGDGADLRGATFGDRADLRGATFGDSAIIGLPARSATRTRRAGATRSTQGSAASPPANPPTPPPGGPMRCGRGREVEAQAVHAAGNVAVWFVGTIVVHDLLLLPLYSLVERVAARLARASARPARAGSPPPPGVLALNHVRVPAMISGLLFLLFFPSILGRNEGYVGASGLEPDVYLGRWLALTGALFVLSGVLYAIRRGRSRAAYPRSG